LHQILSACIRGPGGLNRDYDHGDGWDASIALLDTPDAVPRSFTSLEGALEADEAHISPSGTLAFTLTFTLTLALRHYLAIT
jgi:hypothetical protein